MYVLVVKNRSFFFLSEIRDLILLNLFYLRRWLSINSKSSSELLIFQIDNNKYEWHIQNGIYERILNMEKGSFSFIESDNLISIWTNVCYRWIQIENWVKYETRIIRNRRQNNKNKNTHAHTNIRLYCMNKPK